KWRRTRVSRGSFLPPSPRWRRGRAEPAHGANIVMKWRRHGFPWVVAAAVAAAVLLPIGLMLRLPESRVGASEGKGVPGLWITNPEASDDAVLQDRLRLLDPTPLFLPSSLSSS